MRKILTLFIFLLSLTLQAQSSDFDSLLSKFSAAAAFDETYPREQVTLHLDNDAYIEGETLWFKAYVVRASSLRQVPLSRVLYVELLNDEGAVMERKLVRLDSLGTGSGEFPLVAPIRSGFHELRAYTREMLNWGTEACFSMAVPIFKAPEDKKAAEQTLEIDRPEAEHELTPGHPRPFFFNKGDHAVLRLFPEGGRRAQNLAGRIAFRLTANDGTPRTDSLFIFSADGRPVTTAVPEHEGMGLFTLPAEIAAGEVRIGSPTSKQRLPLPAVDSAAYLALRADPMADGALLHIESRSAESRLLGLAVTCRDRVCYFDTLTIIPGATEILLPHSVMHDGVNRIDLFDPSGRTQASRSVWKDAGSRDLRLTVEQNAETFQPFAPIALKLRLTDAEGRPVKGSFSLSVRDSEGEISANRQPVTDAQLLLRANLDGYVDQPEQYLRHTDAAHRQALDLLLLTRAWHANTFETLCGTDTFDLKQPIEEQLTLNGRVLKDDKKRTPLSGYTLRLNMMSKAGDALNAEAVTDSLGRFAFVSNVDYVGDWLAQFTAKNESGKRRWSLITIDRWFAPDTRAFDARQLIVTPPAQPQAIRPATFTWTDTIPNTVPTQLKEAVVTTKKQYHGFTGNRYSYMGGEKAGIRIADTYYNIHRERERLLDQGIQVQSVGEILSRLNKNINYTTVDDENREGLSRRDGAKETSEKEDAATPDHATPQEEIRFGAESLITFINNDTEGNRNYYPGIDEIKSAVISMDLKNWQRFLPGGYDRSKLSGNVHGLFLYTDPEAYMFRTRRGVEKRHITGYSIPKEFAQPDYRRAEAPNPDDLRRTLLWLPTVTTDDEGCATVIVYANARPDQRIRITARGFTANGRLIHFDQ